MTDNPLPPWTPKQVKRMRRLLVSIDRTIDMMDHPEIAEIVRNWNGPRNLRDNLAEFADWQSQKLPKVDA